MSDRRTLRRAAAAALAVLAVVLAGCAADEADQETSLTMAPGSSASVPFALQGAEDLELRVIDDDGLEVEVPERLAAAQNGSGAWIRITAPEGASGTHEVRVAAGDQELRIEVSVEEPERTPQPGQMVQTRLSSRTSDGLLFTNDAWTANVSLPRDDAFVPPRSPQELEPAPIPIDEAQLPGPLYQALLRVGVDQNVTVQIDEFYGSASQEQDVPRQQEIERVREEDRRLPIDRQQAEEVDLIDNDTQEGDPVDLPGGLPYVVEQLNSTMVVLILDVQEGERYTLHDAWPDASEVVEVGEDNVTFRTEPPVGEGESFTWFDRWPEQTEIVEMTEDTIVLRHSPDEGQTYQEQGQNGRASTVVEVREDVIVVSTANPGPLAGRTITFDIQVLGIEDAPQPGGAPPG